MTHANRWVELRRLALVVALLAGCAVPPSRPAPAAQAIPGSPQLWLTVEEVELTISARVRLVVSVDGTAYSYPAQQDWSDGRSAERFLLPGGKSSYAFRFEATLFDGTRMIAARDSGPFTVDRSTLPLTRQYVRLYPGDARTAGQGAVARLAFSLRQEGQAQEDSSVPQMTAEEVVARLEAAWDSQEFGLEKGIAAWPDSKADVGRMDAELAARLQAKPQDTQTLLLWARRNVVGHQPDHLSAAEAALDRVLAAEPRNADALYHKGRMHGRLIRVGNLRKRADLNGAVSYLRQAVEYAPTNAQYRRTLALFLADQGLPGEARSALGAIRKNDPVSRLLEALAAVPIPEGSEYLLDHMLWGAALMELVASETVEDYLFLRVRFYRIQKSRAEIEAFYAARMPGFRFIRATENPKGESEGDYLQFVRVVSGSARPSRDLREIPDPKRRQAGILMVLYEMRDDPELGRKLGPDEHNCYLLLINTHK